MKVRYLDLATGRTAEDAGISEFNLTENNYSCDCNRAVPFDGPDYDTCEYKRYIVIGVEAEPMDDPFDATEVIKEANREYYMRLQADKANVHHFKTSAMLKALGLSVDESGVLWSLQSDGTPCQKLDWAPEMAISFVVGKMLEEEVRKDILSNAVVRV